MSGERKFFKGQQAFLRREQDFRRVLRDKEEARPGTHVFAWGMLDDVSADLCRYGVSWDGRAYARKFLLDGSVLEVAHFLNGVPVEDPKLARDLSRTFKSLDGRQILRGTKKPQKPSAQPISGQDAAWAATAIMAKARAVRENMSLSKKQERNLDNFVGKTKQALGDLIWGGGRFKQVMAPVTAVAFLFAACNSGASPTIVPTTEAASPTVTEVAPVETETSFPSPIVVTPTEETSPTSTEISAPTLEEQYGDIAPLNPEFPYIKGSVFSGSNRYGISGAFKGTDIHPVFTGNFIERTWYHAGLDREITDLLMETVLRDGDGVLHKLLISFLSPDLEGAKRLDLTDGRGSTGIFDVEGVEQAKNFFKKGDQVELSIVFERPAGTIPKEKSYPDIWDTGVVWNYETVKNYYLYLEQAEEVKDFVKNLIEGKIVIIPDGFVLPGGDDLYFIVADLDQFYVDYYYSEYDKDN